MTIGSAAIPDQYKVRNARSNQLALLLTGLDVAPNGDIYVTDGYASDYIHRFDKTGKYLASFGGKNPPYSFNTLHKLAIDTRFTPARLIACDRANNRVVHLSLDGRVPRRRREGSAAAGGDRHRRRQRHRRRADRPRDRARQERARSCSASARTRSRASAPNKLPPAQWRDGLRAVTARRRAQRARRSLRLGVQRLRARASIQSTVSRVYKARPGLHSRLAV